jgi:RNA polymerase sigma factor (sigma-70 family)
VTASASTSPSHHDDAILARAAATGDRAALGAIYDRYADKLHDFCVGMLRDREAAADCVQDVFVTAATKLAQLREADRLRPWLYAIARSECLARIRDRKREQLSEELPDMPTLDAGPDTLVARAGLGNLIRDVSLGLSDRDRVVLELAYRQGLSGPELADALGVTARNANTLVERLRDTIGRSLGALLVCRRAKTDPAACPELATMLSGWDGQFTVLMRKRVARHIDDCPSCEEQRATMVNPAALLAAPPIIIPAPDWLRERTLDEAIAAIPHTAPTPGQSWWPPEDLDISDLTKPANRIPQPVSRGHRGRGTLGAALLVIGAGAAILLATPPVDVVPKDVPAREVSDTGVMTTAQSNPGDARRTAPSAPPMPPPAVVTPTISESPTTAAPIPRTQDDGPTTTRIAVPQSPPEPSTPVTQPTTPRTTTPETEPSPIVIEPSDEPTKTVTTPKSVPKLPAVEAPEKAPPGDCPPNTDCTPSGPPVFS